MKKLRNNILMKKNQFKNWERIFYSFRVSVNDLFFKKKKNRFQIYFIRIYVK